MADVLYPKGREGFLDGSIDWDTDNIKVVLLTSSYTYNSSHDNLDDITAGYRVATSGNLASKTVTLGVADAADLVFSAVSGSAIASLVVYKDSGAEATSRLIAYIDSYTNLPLTPNGGDITIAWPADANKIFKL